MLIYSQNVQLKKPTKNICTCICRILLAYGEMFCDSWQKLFPLQDDTVTNKLYKGIHFGKLTSKRMGFSGKSGPGPGEYEPYNEPQSVTESAHILETDRKKYDAKLPRYHEWVVKEEEKRVNTKTKPCQPCHQYTVYMHILKGIKINRKKRISLSEQSPKVSTSITCTTRDVSIGFVWDRI